MEIFDGNEVHLSGTIYKGFHIFMEGAIYPNYTINTFSCRSLTKTTIYYIYLETFNNIYEKSRLYIKDAIESNLFLTLKSFPLFFEIDEKTIAMLCKYIEEGEIESNESLIEKGISRIYIYIVRWCFYNIIWTC